MDDDKPTFGTAMVRVYYAQPIDPNREQALSALANQNGGLLDTWELPMGNRDICLIYEFPNLDSATKAAAAFRQRGERVEGPDSS